MNRKAPSKSLLRARRYRQRRRLKLAALSLGLLTTWATGASASTCCASATITITPPPPIKNSATFFNAGGSLTLNSPSVAALSGDFDLGDTGRNFSLANSASFDPNGGYYFAGVIENADGTSDIVMSFPNGGDGAVGIDWTSIFQVGQTLPPCEDMLVDELVTDPFSRTALIQPGTELEFFDSYSRDIVLSPVGETATLVAFTGAANTGEIVGTVTINAIPEPTSLAVLGITAGVLIIGARTRV